MTAHIDYMTVMLCQRQNLQASIEINQGKDFSWDTIEVVGRERKASFMYLAGVLTDWWRHGADNIVTEKKVPTSNLVSVVAGFTPNTYSSSCAVLFYPLTVICI